MSELYSYPIEKLVLLSSKGKEREIKSDNEFNEVDFQLYSDLVIELVEFLGEREPGLFEFKLWYWKGAEDAPYNILYESEARVKLGSRKYEVVAKVRVNDAETKARFSRMEKGNTYPARYDWVSEEEGCVLKLYK